jgi:hypothetical protein
MGQRRGFGRRSVGESDNVVGHGTHPKPGSAERVAQLDILSWSKAE